MVGAFYPLSRNHNANGFRRQDPAAWDPEFAEAVRKIYIERYRLLPYLYTLTYKSSTEGETVARPLFFEFPDDHNTYQIDEQFMWGAKFLISPAVTESNQVKSGSYSELNSRVLAKHDPNKRHTYRPVPLGTTTLLVSGQSRVTTCLILSWTKLIFMFEMVAFYLYRSLT